MTGEELAAREAAVVAEGDPEALCALVVELHARGELRRIDEEVQALRLSAATPQDAGRIEADAIRSMILDYLECPEGTFFSFVCDDSCPNAPAPFGWIETTDDWAVLRAGFGDFKALRACEHEEMDQTAVARLKARGVTFSERTVDRKFAWLLAWAAWDGGPGGRVRPGWAWYPPE